MKKKWTDFTLIKSGWLLLGICGLLFSCGGGNAGDASVSGETANSSGALPDQKAGGAGTPASSLPAAPGEEESMNAGQPGPAASGAAGADVSGQEERARPVSKSPVLDPPQALKALPVQVSVRTPEPGALVYYTLDGSIPVPGKSPLFRNPLTLTQSSLITAVAVTPGALPSAPVTGDFTVGEVWAGPGGAGQGTRTAPLPTLSAAIEKAATLKIPVVRVLEGEITESVEVTSAVQLIGGYTRDFRRIPGARTVILGLPKDNATKKAPAYALKTSGAGASAATLEGLEFRGPESGYSAGLWAAENSSPRFRDVKFTGGKGAYSYGVLISSGASPEFTACVLDGGAGDTNAGLSSDGGQAAITSSLVRAGSGMVSGTGASLTQSVLKASSSVFAGGGANVNVGVAVYNSADVQLEGCTLWGGWGNEATGLFTSIGRPKVRGSLIGSGGTKKSLGIQVNYGESYPGTLEGTFFLGCSTALLFSADTRQNYTQIDGQGRFRSSGGQTYDKVTSPGAEVFQVVLESPDFRTPASLAVRTAPSFKRDRPEADPAGVPRTEPWTPGAYELD